MANSPLSGPMHGLWFCACSRLWPSVHDWSARNVWTSNIIPWARLTGSTLGDICSLQYVLAFFEHFEHLQETRPCRPFLSVFVAARPPEARMVLRSEMPAATLAVISPSRFLEIMAAPLRPSGITGNMMCCPCQTAAIAGSFGVLPGP